MAKSADAFRTISEVSEWLDTPAHVLRFWESRFSQVKPVKRAGGRRYYRPADMQLLGGIRRLLHDDGITIKGVQKILREKGVKYVCGLSHDLPAEGAEVDSDSAIAVKATPIDDILTEGAETVPMEKAAPDTAKTPVADTPDEDADLSDRVADAARHIRFGLGKAMPEDDEDDADSAPDQDIARIHALYHRLKGLRDRMYGEMMQS